MNNIFTTSNRDTENKVIRLIDNNRFVLANIHEQGSIEAREERASALRTLSMRHKAYVADTRKALAFCFSKTALYVLISEMAAHDKALNAKAGRDFSDTYTELERAIESVSVRLNRHAPMTVTVDTFAIARKEIINRGSVRLEMMSTTKQMKVKYALSMTTCRELVKHGWQVAV